MGQPKALLPAAGDTFLRRAVDALRAGGCDEVTVVVRPPADDDSRRIDTEARASGAAVVAADSREQVDSLRAALRADGGAAEAVVVTPVDLPHTGGGVVAALIGAFRGTRAPVVVPTYRGVHGHPVLFSRAVFAELLDGALPEGARSVVHAHAHELAEVAVEEAGVLHDVDTPADYRRHVAGPR